MLKKLTRWVKSTWYGLFGALKVTEEEVFKPEGVNINSTTTINQEVHDKRVSTALLAGKETQEVKELRYRTYAVDRKSREFEYISPMLTVKREKQDTKFIHYDKTDGLPLITIQNNFPIVESVEQGLEQVGKRGKQTEYWISISRKFGFLPRYRLEEYTKRLVVKEKTEGKTAVIEFYVTKYPNDKDLKSKGFVKEIEYVKEKSIRSDVLDIDSVTFITNHAYNKPDLLMYTFKVKNFKNVYEYDGHYVICYLADIIVNGRDMTDDYYNSEMAEKYRNKERKEVVHDLMAGDVETVYTCEDCGKEFVFNPKKIDEKEASDTVDDNGEDVTKYIDLQIAESTFGKRLCPDCLKKYLEEVEKIM